MDPDELQLIVRSVREFVREQVVPLEDDSCRTPGALTVELPARVAYAAGMNRIQYTVRGVSSQLDERLRDEARQTGRSLNAVVIETLENAKLPGPRMHDDLDWFVGSAVPDAHKGAREAQEWMDSMPAGLE